MKRAWLRPAIPAGAILLSALLLLGGHARPASADPNEVRIEPAALEVAPGGTVTVAVIADPPATTVTVWGLDILFDPSVVTMDDFGCDGLDSQPDSTTISVCITASSTGGDVRDLAKVLGGVVYKSDTDDHQAGDGLTEETTLADLTFDVVGQPGQCTDLRLFVRFHIDRGSEETNPSLLDGRICIVGDAPASGTAVPTQAVPRTPDPTAPGGDVNQPTLPPFDDTGAPGNGDQTSGEGTEDGSPGETVSGTGATGTARTAGPNGAPIDEEDDDGGLGTLFWGVLGLGALLVVAGFAWAMVRGRSAGASPGE